MWVRASHGTKDKRHEHNLGLGLDFGSSHKGNHSCHGPTFLCHCIVGFLSRYPRMPISFTRTLQFRGRSVILEWSRKPFKLCKSFQGMVLTKPNEPLACFCSLCSNGHKTFQVDSFRDGCKAANISSTDMLGTLLPASVGLQGCNPTWQSGNAFTHAIS